MIQKWYNPFLINGISIFLITALSGTVITISSNSWWVGWLGMEINLLGFIILLLNNNSNESTLKYFVVQSLGSVILIRRALLLENFIVKNFLVLLNLALLLKMGAAPLHFWLPIIIENINKWQVLFLLTWQKLAPLYLLFSLPKSNTILLFIISRLIIGAIGSLNELRLFTLITYSSINHTGWILLALLVNELTGFVYLAIYTIILISIIISINKKNNQINWFIKNNLKFIIFMNLLSLGGLPPFTGFIIKWILLIEIYNFINVFVNFILILTSIILIYFYLRLTINRFLNNNIIINNINNNENNNIIIFSIINLPLFYFLICIISIISTFSF